MKTEVLRLMGRCCDGAERDSGTLFHAVPTDNHKALCGRKPGRRSAGWIGKRGAVVTCPRCIRVQEKAAESTHDTRDGQPLATPEDTR